MDERHNADARPFRQRLDDVLCMRDPEAVRAFLVAEGQWGEDEAGDIEASMWMMIAGSPGLTSLYAQAEQWLRTHGHVAEAEVIAGSRKRSSQPGGQRRQGSASSRERRGKQRDGGHTTRPPRGSGDGKRQP
jgi:hypothetical protein